MKQIALCIDKQIIYTRYQNGKLIPKKTVHTFNIRKRYFYYEFRVTTSICSLETKLLKLLKQQEIKKLYTSSQQNNIKLTLVHNVMLEYMIELINYTIYK